jgi:hypothetical protein
MPPFSVADQRLCPFRNSAIPISSLQQMPETVDALAGDILQLITGVARAGFTPAVESARACARHIKLSMFLIRSRVIPGMTIHQAKGANGMLSRVA